MSVSFVLLLILKREFHDKKVPPPPNEKIKIWDSTIGLHEEYLPQIGCETSLLSDAHICPPVAFQSRTLYVDSKSVSPVQ